MVVSVTSKREGTGLAATFGAVVRRCAQVTGDAMKGRSKSETTVRLRRVMEFVRAAIGRVTARDDSRGWRRGGGYREKRGETGEGRWR